MLRAIKSLVLTGALLATLATGAVATADTLTASVTLNATIPPTVAVTLVDAETLNVRSNCGWTIEVITASGSSSFNGGKSSGTEVPLPVGTISYTVVADR